VTAQDAYGNTATGYTGTVHFTSSDGQAVLPGNSTLSNGTGTFSTILKTASSESLTATDTATSSVTGSARLSVIPAAASTLVVTAPASATAGAAFPVTVTARDAYGNTATGYTGTVHFSTSDPAAGVMLPAAYTFTATDQGTHTFTGVALGTPGSQTVTATDGAAGSITGSATVSVVAPASATHLGVSVPGGVTAGSTFSITVTALAANGSTATGYTGTVQFSSSDGQAVLPGSYTFTAADHGVHTFTGLVLDTAGTQSLTVRDSAGSSITGNATVSVSPAASGALVFQANNLPQTLLPSEVFVSSVINVPQNVTIGSLKVQVNITYPLDSQLRIDLIHIDPSGFLRSVLVLSDFVGAGANFQNTTFDDAAATPIAAGVPPFASSYRPTDPLSALAGQNAQGTWVLEVGDFAGGTGTLNSWSLTITPASSPALAPAAPALSAPLSTSPTAMPPLPGQPAAGSPASTAARTAGAPTPLPTSGLVPAALNAGPPPSTSLAGGNTLMGGQANALAMTPAAAPLPAQPNAGLGTFAGVHVGGQDAPVGADNLFKSVGSDGLK
jgi:subtilisin-like proprotein convertase family protein